MNTIEYKPTFGDLRARKQISRWLLTGYFMVFIMLILGGITRLTQSGLSIVEWNVIMGIVPPMNETEWNTAFEKYRQFPEYKILNKTMTVEEFKSIFWWEYIHRLWGRLIGIVFIIPFTWFLIQKRFTPAWIGKLALVFLIGAFQGFMGWYMVQSGLIENPHVSHYRLTMHLFLAFTICGLLLWYTMSWLPQETSRVDAPPSLRKFATGLMLLILMQSMLGGLVAGLKAGYMYNTYPKMGEAWLPESAWMMDPAWMNFFENGIMIQFMHRTLALIVAGAVFVFWLMARKRTWPISLSRSIHFLFLITLIQLSLGITTILLAVPVFWGVVHQAGALVLFSAAVWVRCQMTHRPLTA